MITAKRLVATGVAVLAPVAILIAYLSLRSTLPDPLPVHWDVRGAVDNTASTGWFFGTDLVIAVVLAAGVAAAIWLSHSPMAGRMLAGLVMFGCWLAAAIGVVTMAMSSGAARAQDVTLPWYFVALFVVVPALIAAGTWWLLPGRWGPPVPIMPGSSITLAPGEKVVWLGHEHSAVLRSVAAAAAVAGAILLFVRLPVGIVVFVLALVMGAFSELAVRIDDRGVHTLWGPFGWPRSRIPLADIVAARAEQIEPMQWGGWGYRVSRHGVAAVIRRGPGLVIERNTKPTYAVTVPQAERGADVLNALLARERSQDRQ